MASSFAIQSNSELASLTEGYAAKPNLSKLRQLIAEGEESGEAKPWGAESFLAKMRNKHSSNSIKPKTPCRSTG